MRNRLALLVSILSLSAAACGASPSAHTPRASAPHAGAPMRPSPAEARADAPAAHVGTTPPGAPPPSKAELGATLDKKPAASAPTDKLPDGKNATRSPMLVYVGTYDMSVADVAGALVEIETLAREMGGFLAKRDDRTITFRVPVSSFAETQSKLGKVGEIVHRDVVAEDVTEEMSDLEARLKNARAMRDRMEHLLQKAANIPDSISIERELARITAEIERMEGRAKLLRDRAAFSTLTVRLTLRKVDTPTIAAPPPPPPPPRRPKLNTPWLKELGLNHLQTF